MTVHVRPQTTAGTPLVRAALAAAVQHIAPAAERERAVRATLHGDPAAQVLYRAATAPGSLTADAWGGVLGNNVVADFVMNLGPTSAAAALFDRALRVDLGTAASAFIPGMVTSATAAGFVAEGQPIAVTTGAVGGASLAPGKIAAIAACSRELLRSSAAEAVLSALLSEAAALALDAALFSDAAAVADERPAGLLNGVTPIAASVGGDDVAMLADLAALVGAVAPVAGGDVVLVGDPTLPLRLAARRMVLPYSILTTGALPAGTVIAVAPRALAVAVNPVPEIDISEHAVLHMSDAPLPIRAGGVTADPVRSLWQTASIATRMTLGVGWALRSAGAVAFVENATW